MNSVCEYATLDDIDQIEADPHIKGTIRRGGDRLEFWLSAPRPARYTIDEWEEIQEAKWNRIFGKKEKV